MTAPVPMSRRRLLGAYWTETRFEILRILRAPEFFVPVAILPIAFYLLLGVAMRDMRGASSHGSTDFQVFISFAVYAAFGVGLINVGIQLAVDRTFGILGLKRAMPLPPACYLVAKMAAAVLFTVVILAALIALATTLGHVVLPPDRLASIMAIMVLGMVPACAIGLCVAAHVSLSGASAIVNVLFIGMMMLGGLFYPLPGVLEQVRSVWPAYHLHQLGLAAAGAPNDGQPVINAMVLTGVAVVFAGLAARRLARSG